MRVRSPGMTRPRPIERPCPACKGSAPSPRNSRRDRASGFIRRVARGAMAREESPSEEALLRRVEVTVRPALSLIGLQGVCDHDPHGVVALGTFECSQICPTGARFDKSQPHATLAFRTERPLNRDKGGFRSKT